VEPLLNQWIVECRLAYFDSPMHGGGVLNPNDKTEFHGTELKRSHWDLEACARCHGADFAGGKASASCLNCHTNGPTACQTCHRSDPVSGAHLTHSKAPVTERPSRCNDCHRVPLVWNEPGHLFTADGRPVERAVVTFGAAASVDGGIPMWDGVGCSSVACHGGGFDDTQARQPRPQWVNPTPATTQCNSCHGTPPSNHGPEQRCELCHARVAASGLTLIDKIRHLDGVVDVGNGSGTCAACHADGKTIPFADTEGSTDTSLVTVGAHDSHLHAPHALSAPMACGECHRIPLQVMDPGHIDNMPPAQVFPSDGQHGLAWADNTTPAFDPATVTCTTYCHGGGEKLQRDTSVSISRAPRWTDVGSGAASCARCHGIPPQDNAHTAEMTLNGCVECHAGAVDEFGRVLFAPNGASLHINGVIDGP
jgi:predicted CxxxxCH...CXXCH cytochrome family protein